MEKITKSTIAAIILTVLCFFALPAQAKYNGGSGDPCDPYQINDPCQLNAIGADPCDWDKHFILTADIDLSAYTGEQFNIIAPDADNMEWGFQGTMFTGSFDGNDHTISNFTYNSTDTDYVGIFGYIGDSSAIVQNLTLLDPCVVADNRSYIGSLVGYLENGNVNECRSEGGYITGGSNVGGLVGFNSGTISHCYSTSNVFGNGSDVGGLVGRNEEGAVSYCYTTGSISGNGNYTGGLMGYNSGTISHCYSTSNVFGNSSNVGGLVGRNHDTITSCYSTGTVTGNGSYLGGLVGNNYDTITNCYATGTVTGNSYCVGGLVGSNNDIVSNCYSTGPVSGNGDYAGGLVGRNGGFVHSSYWDIETSGLIVSEGGKGETTQQMQSATTYIGWGCGDWTIDEGNDYPHLAWQNIPGEPIIDPDPVILYGGGEGTLSEPYLIYTAEQLNNIGLYNCHWNYHFRLMVDIDLSGYTGTDFNIIGYPFTGTFDGAGYTIFHFTYSTTDKKNGIGLFGYLNEPSALIQSLTLSDPCITTGSGRYVGSLVGRMGNGTIADCSMENGTISGDYYIGGLVGLNDSGSISNCHATGSISGNGSDIGGLVGYSSSGNLYNCYAIGYVTGNGNFIGGLVGRNDNMFSGGVIDCYANVDVTGNSHFVGGLVGSNWSGNISNCHADGDVTANGDSVGGLVGYSMNMGVGNISNCYATGRVIGNGDFVGGLVGQNSGIISASFWDIQTSGQTTSFGGIGLNTEQMKSRITFTGAGWDFTREIANGAEDVWLIVDGLDYPRLTSQYYYGGGEGTEQQPYLIYTPVELSLIGDKPDNHFLLMNDIDGQEYCGIGPRPIGEYPDYPFSGVFDGNGHTIYNFAYEVAAQDFVGLFGYVTGEGAEIKNLRLVDVDIYAATGDYVGGLVGYNNGGRLTNVSVTGSVTGWGGVGGLVGVNYDGLARQCYADCTVDGYEDTGGLVGINYNDVTNCHSAGSVIGMRFVGGLVGYNWDGDITNSFSTGSVTAFDFFGGLIGYNRDGTVSDSFWDVQTSGQSTSYGGTGLDTALMQTQSTFTDTGWDFVGEDINGTDDAWRMCVDGIDYPKLSWQFLPGDFVCSDGVDLADFAVLADTWGLSSGQVGYNDLCDLMDDDVIDLADLAVFVENWLEGK